VNEILAENNGVAAWTSENKGMMLVHVTRMANSGSISSCSSTSLDFDRSPVSVCWGCLRITFGIAPGGKECWCIHVLSNPKLGKAKMQMYVEWNSQYKGVN
jgi:hypothetical protein